MKTSPLYRFDLYEPDVDGSHRERMPSSSECYRTSRPIEVARRYMRIVNATNNETFFSSIVVWEVHGEGGATFIKHIIAPRKKKTA